MDLTKNSSDLNQEKKFYCPTEGCVFSKGYGKSFKKKMLVDQVRKFLASLTVLGEFADVHVCVFSLSLLAFSKLSFGTKIQVLHLQQILCNRMAADLPQQNLWH